MRVLILLTAYILSVALAVPQLLTFKDGKVGVNFGGYHAEAGLGGLLTGNAAHGGLSASAGTPNGQNAAAGLGGSVNGRSSGYGYAGAQAMPSVGASAVLGGTAGESGFLGSEAYANGNALTKTIAANSNNRHHSDYDNNVFALPPPPPPPQHHAVAVNSRSDFVQKIKPSKKHTLIKVEQSVDKDANAVHPKHLNKSFRKSVNTQTFAQLPDPPTSGPYNGVYVQRNANGQMLYNIFNIPIGILRSIQESLSGIPPQQYSG